MPLSNLTKKAMAFAVTILCSLASIGVGGPAKPKETPPTMHDSLYDSWVATAYNALPNDPDIEPCLDGFYAPVYFSNLRTNFGTNRFGTCAFVAMGMLFSFYDTYWDDSIVPDAYEVAAHSYGDPTNGSVDSPGSSDSVLDMTDYTTFGQYMSSGVPELEGSRLDAKLISLASYYMNFGTQDGNATGLDYSGMYSLFQYYLYSYMGFSTSDIGFLAEPGTGTGQAKSDSVRDYAIDMVMEGTPVLLSVGTDLSATTGRHAVIAYDYDEDNDLLYCHMGWGPKATHCTIESFGYTSYNSAFTLAVRTSHNCSNNYKKIDQWGNTISTHCACRFGAPYDIKAVDWHRNEEPGFEWSCVDKEGWVGDFIKYNLNILNCSNETVNNGEKKWALKWQDKINNQGAYDMFNQSPVSVTISVEYDDGYHNISSISRSATFPWITDFSGAHNVHPGDYAYSPNTPMTTGQTTHNIDGLSFKTNRKGVYEESDMVSLLYAGSGFNDSYIRYSDFQDGDSVIGVDFGIRLWEGTNAIHGLSIEYYDGSSWNESADLLESDYDIAGSNGAIRWVHHSFGAPVSAFSIHAFSSGAGNNDYGVAGLLTMAIYTVNDIVSPLSGSELRYLPCLWNNNSTIKNYSNCYRYALNFPNNNQSQDYWDPGEYDDPSSYYPCEKEITVEAATKDSIAFKLNNPSSNAYFGKIGRMETCPSGCYKVALFIGSNNGGLHWFRQNDDGTWSQKDGTGPVTNLDESESPMVIIDPQFCKTHYNYFCGYYCVGPWTN